MTAVDAVPPWLFVVDMQVCFADPGSPWVVPEYSDAEHIVCRLLAHFGTRSVLTRFVSNPAADGSWADYYRIWPSMVRPPDDAAWDLTLEVPAGAVEVTRGTFSKWDDHVAAALEPDARLVMCGVSTETCVLATVLDAVDAGRHIVLVEDACRGVDGETHRSAIRVLRSFWPQVEVLTSEQLFAGPELP